MSLIITIAYGAAFALLAFAVWRKPRRPSLKARIAAVRELTAAAPAVETEPGINLADLDACELMLNDPEFAARCDRLWQAIRDDQPKGDQK